MSIEDRLIGKPVMFRDNYHKDDILPLTMKDGSKIAFVEIDKELYIVDSNNGYTK